MRRVMYAVLLTGLFLLMLSALVVTPETPEAAPCTADFSGIRAVFRPVVSALLPDTADLPARRPAHSAAPCILPVLLIGTALFFFVRDANGHVLSAVRYEDSVYQLFRPEVAGG